MQIRKILACIIKRASQITTETEGESIGMVIMDIARSLHETSTILSDKFTALSELLKIKRQTVSELKSTYLEIN